MNTSLAGGGTVAVRVVSSTVRIRWDTRMLALPLMGKAGVTYYNIECPASGTIGTGQFIDADGIPMGPNFNGFNGFSARYYQMPTGSSQFTTPVRNFRTVPFLNTIENIEPNWVLLAALNTDTSQAVVKWQAGGVVLPLPEDGQQIQWGSNLGRGASKIVLDGGTGRASFPGVVRATQASVPPYRVSPATNGNESSIAFYRNSNFSIPSTGDVWVVGHSTWGIGAGNFAIGLQAMR